MNIFNNLSPSVANLETVEIITNLVLAFVLGLLVAVVHRLTNRHKAASSSFAVTLVVMAMVVALVMMVIGNSIARAFSLVGALSIIRFRTVVKDNRDIAFVFFALAAGMSAGIGNYKIALFGAGTIIFMILILDFIQFGVARKGVFLLRFQIIPTDADEHNLEDLFVKMLTSYNRISVKLVRMGQFVEHSYLIRLKRGISEQIFLSQLSTIEGIDRVSLISEESDSEK